MYAVEISMKWLYILRVEYSHKRSVSGTEARDGKAEFKSREVNRSWQSLRDIVSCIYSPNEVYLIALKKLFSLIFFLLAFLMASLRSSLAFCASLLSFNSIPAGRSIDCSSSGTLAILWVAALPVFRARAAFEARRRCFLDLARKRISQCTKL